jgi:hypothetical protein
MRNRKLKVVACASILLGLAAAAAWIVQWRGGMGAGAPSNAPDSLDVAIDLANLTPGHRKMLTVLAEIRDQTPHQHPFYGPGIPEAVRAELEALGPDAGASQRGSALLRAAIAELAYEPTPQRAIEHLHQADDLLAGLAIPNPSLSNDVKFLLGTAYLRQGEVENCCLSSNADSCILPIQRGGVHTRTEGSRQAIAYYLDCLKNPGTSQTDLCQRYSAIWLLNVAYMTLDEYPDHVPPQFRIPPEFFESSIDFPRFENVMPKLRLDTMNHAGGVVVDDFDNDDYLDILTCSAGPTMPTRFFRNNRDGTFSDRTREAGLTGLYGGLNLVPADYNNDGHLDVYIIRGAWMASAGQHPDSLLRNDGNARFTDVTFEAGLGEVRYPNKTAAWGDYDNDGDLDLFVGNESNDANDQRYKDRFPPGVTPVRAPSQLFRNQDDGTFTDVAAEAGVQIDAFCMGSVWGDFDSDRYPDLFVSGPSFLFHNNRDGTLTNVTAESGISRPHTPFATWFWDFDNDAALDLFVTASAGSLDRVALRALGEEIPSGQDGVVRLRPSSRSPATEYVEYEIPALYRGDGRGGFTEVARQQGLTFPVQPMGCNFGDLNGDGYLDFYLTTGNVPYWDLWPNAMYLNQGGSGFENVTMSGGFGHLQKGHGVSFADIDNDGDQDVYSQRGGQSPGDIFSDALFENPGFGAHWITIKLIGDRSNKSAIGATIRVNVVEDGVERSIYRHVGSGGSFGCNPLRQNIGLGRADEIESIEIYWPTTDLRQTFHDIEMDQAISITEGDDRWQSLTKVRPVKLGGS